jgi:DNA modification methylase
MATKQAIAEHQIIKIKIKDLVFDPSNPNVMTDRQMHGLRMSMRKFGYLTPLVVDMHNKIADGEHRAIIYKEMGYEEIPVIKMKLDTEADRRQLRQVLNKLHGTHDKEKDSDELLHIFESQKLDELALMIAQPKDQLLQVLQQYHPEYDFLKSEESIFEEDLTDVGPANTKLGDIYELGHRHRLICADSTDPKSILKKLLTIGEHSHVQPDLVLTDPPYNIKFKYQDHKDNMTQTAYIDFCRNWYKVVKQTGCNRIIITPGPNNITLWNEITGGEQPTDIGTWYESNSHSQGKLFQVKKFEPILFYGDFDKKQNKRMNDYFDFTMATTPNLHNTERIMTGKIHRKEKMVAPAKPLKLINELLRTYCEPNNAVLDLFTGSGTTLIACEQTDRTFYGSEIDPHYCDLIVKRYEKYTGKEVAKV